MNSPYGSHGINCVYKKGIENYTSHEHPKTKKRAPLKGKAMQILLGLHAIYNSPLREAIYPLSANDERLVLAFAEFAGKYYAKGIENGTPVYTNRGFEAAKLKTKLSADAPGNLLSAIANTYVKGKKVAISWEEAAKLIEQLVRPIIPADDGILYAERRYNDASVKDIRNEIQRLLEKLRMHYKSLDNEILGISRQAVKNQRIAKYVSMGVYAMLKCLDNSNLPPIENSVGGFIELASLAEVAGRHYNENGEKMQYPATDKTISQQEPYAMFIHILNSYKKFANADFETDIAKDNIYEFIDCLPEKVEEKETMDKTVAAALVFLLFNEIPKKEKSREVGVQLSLGI